MDIQERIVNLILEDDELNNQAHTYAQNQMKNLGIENPDLEDEQVELVYMSHVTSYIVTVTIQAAARISEKLS